MACDKTQLGARLFETGSIQVYRETYVLPAVHSLGNNANDIPSFILAARLDAVKKQLAEAEALEAAADAKSLPHKLHPASFVRIGLEIEDQQCVARAMAYECSLTLFNPGNR